MIRNTAGCEATAAYLRISRKDGDKAESDSIGNQRALLDKFIDSSAGEFSLFKHYIDDDFTGTNFDRPAFKEMMEDIKQKRVSCIIVKDLSRFGRDYIDVGNYLQKIYPKMGVRFIAINDNIDSGKQAYDMLMPMKNIFNEQYARDISQKVKTALHSKQQNGEFIGAFASYGYDKDPLRKGHLLVDHYAAGIVQRIFQMYNAGMGKMSIARVLNDEGILCPAEYKKDKGARYCNANQLTSTVYWTYSTINKILQNEIYTGKMVQGKSNFSRYRASSSRLVAKEDWAIVPDTHEAIISDEIWEATQQLLTKRTREIDFNANVSVFAGFLKCGDCGRAMSKITTGGRVRFVCGTYKRYSKELCASHRIFEDDLSEIVLTGINDKIERVHDIVEYIELRERDKRYKTDRAKLQQSIKKLEGQLGRISGLKMGLYEDYKGGILTIEEYSEYKDKYQEQEMNLTAQLDSLRQSVKGDSKDIMDNPLIKMLKERGRIEILTRPMLGQLIDNIQIYEGNRIVINYRFDLPDII